MSPTTPQRGITRTNSVRGLFAATATLAAACISAHGQTSFTHDIGFGDFGYQHGSIVAPGAYSGFQYLSPQINVTPPSGSFDKAVIFNTQDPGNSVSKDQDLIPSGSGNVGNSSFGNIAIIQENTAFTVDSNGRINDPYNKVEAHSKGGTFSFDLNPGAGVTVDSIRLDLINIKNASQIKIVAYDGSGSFTWTGANLKTLNSTIDYGSGSANRTSFLTASQAGLSSITRFEIISNKSFGVDNIILKGTANVNMVPEVSSSFLTASSMLLLCFRRRRQAC